jgi:hypothetical protein
MWQGHEVYKKCGDGAGNYVTHILQNDWYGWLQNTNLTMTIKGVNTELISMSHDCCRQPPKQNYILAKRITMHKTASLQWNANKSFLIVKLIPILQICSKENLPIITVTITSLTTEWAEIIS